jgi:hypothetical protein
MANDLSHAFRCHKTIATARRALFLGFCLVLFIQSLPLRSEVMYWPTTALDLAKQQSYRSGCLNNLWQIAWAAFQANPSKVPTNILQLTNQLFALPEGPSVLFCPADLGRQIPTNWADVDFQNIDYLWNPPPGVHWDDPDICCECRIHNQGVDLGRLVHPGDERTGWPSIIAGVMGPSVTPGSDAQLEVLIAPDAIEPVTYQWWKGLIDTPGYTAVLLSNETNRVLSIQNAQTNDDSFYTVRVTNPMGTTESRAALHIDPLVSNYVTNEQWSANHCINNLKQIGVHGRLWARDHEDELPFFLAQMVNKHGIPVFGWPLSVYCRSDVARSVPSDWLLVDLSDTSYEVLPANGENLYDLFARCKVHGHYVEVQGSVVTAPGFQSILRVTNAITELNLKVFANRTNMLEVTTNMTHWSHLKTYTPTNGIFSFSETNDSPSRFYRLRMP